MVRLRSRMMDTGRIRVRVRVRAKGRLRSNGENWLDVLHEGLQQNHGNIQAESPEDKEDELKMSYPRRKWREKTKNEGRRHPTVFLNTTISNPHCKSVGPVLEYVHIKDSCVCVP